jgi:hypothetical protein
MTQAFIQLPPDSTGKQLAADTWAQGANTVYGQNFVIYGPDGTPISRQVSGAKNAIDVNLAASTGGAAQVTGVLTSATVPSTPDTVTNAAAVVAAVGSSGNCTIVIVGGSYTGAYKLNFEASDDGGTTWTSVTAVREDSALSATNDTVTGAAGAGPTHMWSTALPGFTHFRVRATAVPGTITTGVTVRITPGPFLVETNPMTQSAPLDGSKATYSAVIDQGSIPATVGDFLEMRAGSTVVMRVTEISFTLIAQSTTAAGMTRVDAIKRSTQDAGGTAIGTTSIGHDSNDAAAASTVVGYSAAPSAGTSVGFFRSWKMYVPASSAVANPPQIVETFGTRPAKAIVLRPSQSLGLYFPVAPAATTFLNAYVEWTEEAL